MPISSALSLKQLLKETKRDWDHDGIPTNVRENLWKVMNCGTAALGAEVFASPTEIKIIYHTCKSRFCPSCGARSAAIWQSELEVAIPDIPYPGNQSHDATRVLAYISAESSFAE